MVGRSKVGERDEERWEHDFEVRGGDYRYLSKKEAKEARKRLEELLGVSVIKSGTNLEDLERFLGREYKPEKVDTAGAYKLALKELREKGVNVSAYLEAYCRIRGIKAESFYELRKPNLKEFYLKLVGRVKQEIEEMKKGRQLYLF